MEYRKFIYLDGVEYNVNPLEYSFARPLKSYKEETQGTPAYQYKGSGSTTHRLTLLCYSAFEEFTTGITTTGRSQLASLEASAAKMGASVPLLYVSPIGATYNVIFSGQLEVNLLDSSTTGNSRAPEFSVNITLEEV